jgi:hypothetical protein
MPDVQPKTGPALSATSDMPEIKAAPPALSEQAIPAKVEKPAAETKPAKVEAKTDGEITETGAEKPGTTEETEGEDGKGVDTTPPWMKAKISKANTKARLAEAAAEIATKRADALTANLTKALEGIESLTKAQAATLDKEADKQDPRPARDTYDDPTKYESDLVDWADRRAKLIAKADSEKAVADALAKEKTDAAAVKAKEENDKTLAEFAERKAKFIEDHPDYEDLVENADPDKELQISIPMANAILNDEDGPAIAYYLGQNPDEASRISKLPGVRAIAELGRIAARLNAKPAPATKPAPIKVLKTGSETATRKTAAEESMEEYGARRQRELANARRTQMGLAPLN